MLLFLDTIVSHSAVQTVSSQNDNIDYIRQLQDFYNDAWDKLIWTAGSLGGIAILVLGVIVPIVQSRKLRLEREDLQRQFTAEIRTVTTDLNSQFVTELQSAIAQIKLDYTEHIRNETSALKKELKKSIDSSEGFSYSLQGNLCLTENRFADAFDSHLASLKYFIRGGSISRLKTAISNCTRCTTKLNSSQIREIFKQEMNGTAEDYFAHLLKLTSDDESKELLSSLKEKIIGVK